MTYAYDDWVLLPTRDLYDTLVMVMAINAAKDMYDKGLEAVKDFYKTYGDFMSPFSKDMQRYGEMMGGVRKIVDDAYANGVDLLKSPEGRALIQRAIYSVDPGEYNMMKSNAKAGYAYLDAVLKLAASGKYSPDYEDYISSLPGNVAFSDFSTRENKTWNRMPAEYSTLLDFVHPSFAHLKPHLLTSKEAMERLGSEYDSRAEYKGITKSDMEASMREALPGLVGNTMYGFYRKQAEDLLIAEGNSNPTDAQINERFVQNAVTADHLMMLPLDSDYGRYYKEQDLRLKSESNALLRAKFAWEKEKEGLELELKRQKQIANAGGPGTNLLGLSLAGAWYDSALAKAWSADGITMNWNKMGNSYEQFGQNVDRIFHDFGLKFKDNNGNELERLLLTHTGLKYNKQLEQAYNKLKSGQQINADQKALLNRAKSEVGSIVTQNRVLDIQNAYENQFSIPMDRKAVAKIIGTPLNDNKEVARISAGIIDRIYSVDDVISNTAGYSRTHNDRSTKEIRNLIELYKPENVTATSLSTGYGSLRKNTGSFEVMPKVRLMFTNPETGKSITRDCYVDIDLGSEGRKGGAYYGNYKETGGVKQYDSMTQTGLPHNIGTYQPFVGDDDLIYMEYVPGIRNNIVSTRGFTRSPRQSIRLFNMYPDYNRWTGFGVWDTDVTADLLHAGQTLKLGTY